MVLIRKCRYGTRSLSYAEGSEKMLYKKRLPALFFSLALFGACAWWVWSSLTGAFSSLLNEQQKSAIQSASASVPTDPSQIPGWLSRLKEQKSSFDLLYVSLDDGTQMSSDPELERFYNEQKDTPQFRRGFESAGYEETFNAGHYRIGGKDREIYFAPSYDAEKYVSGVVMFSFDVQNSLKFQNLMTLFAVGGFCLFAALLCVARLSRDAFLSFSVLGLVLIALVFIVYPLYSAVRLTFTSNGHFSTAVWKGILTNPSSLEALFGSLKLGVCTATLSTAVGFLFAFVLTRTHVRGKNFLGAMATLPVISPPFSLTLSIMLLFGNNGLISKALGWTSVSIYGLGGLTLVQTMGMFPIAFLTLSGVLEAIDSTLEDVALDLSATRWTTFRTVTLPLSMPGILSAWLLVFTNSLADFANPMILAGNLKVLSVEAYLEVTGMNHLGEGAALSLLLLLPTLTAFLVQRFWVSRRSYVTVTGKPSGRLREITSPGCKRVLVTAVWAISLFLIALYGTIVAGCFVKNWGIDYTFSLSNITEALSRAKDAFADTITLAACATPIAGLLAMLAAVILVRRSFHGKRLLEALLMTPFALPGTLVGISYILAFNKYPLLLVGTGAIIVINYVVRELPVGIEGGVASLRQIDPSIEEAAQDLGASSAVVFKTIVLPLIRPAFISSLSYTFVRAMTAVSAIIFLISARWNHLTVLILNFSENLRFGYASVLSTVLIIIVLAAFGLMRLIVRKNENLEKNLV
jgi:iron(III) transport system permease protein